MKKMKDYYPKLDILNLFERWFLRWSCYFPPIKRRDPSKTNLSNLDEFINTYQKAFSPNLWPLCEGKSVLDFGCGDGRFVLALAKMGAGLVVGYDLQDEFSIAKEEAERQYLENLQFVSNSSTNLPLTEFEVVISHDSFEHFENPKEVLQEMVKFTKKGGTILIKFGPPWKNPWGRHMSGTIRKDRPWVHLLVPEKAIMRVHSVYHNEPVLKEKYSELQGGLNKLTIKRFKKLLLEQPGIKIVDFQTKSLRNWKILKWPILLEFFASGVYARILKT